MEQEIRFTEEELTNIKEIQAEYQKKIYELGQIEVDKMFFQTKLEQLHTDEKLVKEALLILHNNEKEFIEKLSKTYGPGTLDFNTGIFNPLKK